MDLYLWECMLAHRNENRVSRGHPMQKLAGVLPKLKRSPHIVQNRCDMIGYRRRHRGIEGSDKGKRCSMWVDF